MARYVRGTLPVTNYWDDDAPLIPDLSVSEHKPVYPGLLWSTGEPIMRLPNPIGFGRDHDW